MQLGGGMPAVNAPPPLPAQPLPSRTLLLCVCMHACAFLAVQAFLAYVSPTGALVMALMCIPFLYRLSYQAAAEWRGGEGSLDRISTPGERQRLLLSPSEINLLLTDRDFDSNDYERLLLLDENNVKKSHGATDFEINRLPVVTMSESMLNASKGGVVEDSKCSICLEELVVGTKARMVPCFHRFHPGCIDPWLKDKAECPICKYPAVA
ncbi:hypothetical protein H257_07533 [Aphanomyces astaci]|nr:hypothetical protein H257_07533 [Aphanomyces astaci]ETV78679.1 hypothetical protein H257_07533 [Aphanomyces astaci]|eukprot:XP_009831398.1 hypothetical protein H257_07533 [Aphanomyces astaci]